MASMPPVEGSAAHGELDLYAGVGPEGFAHENVQNEGPEAAYAADLYEDVLVKPEGDANHNGQQYINENSGDAAGLEYKSYTTVHPKSQLQQEKEAKIAASLHSRGERGKQLYIGNLTWWTTDEELANLIQECGVTDLINIKFFDNRVNGQSKGFAMIEVGSDTSQRLVLERIGNQEIHGNKPEAHFVNKQTLGMLEAVARKNKPGIPGPPGDIRMGPGGIARMPFGRGDRFPRPSFHRPGMPPHGMPPHGMPPHVIPGEMPAAHFIHGGPPPQHRAPFPGMGPPLEHGMPPGGPPIHGMPPPQMPMDPMAGPNMPGPGMQVMHGAPPGMPGAPGMHGMPGMPGFPPVSAPPPATIPPEAMMHERPPMVHKSGIAPHVNPAFLPPDAAAQGDAFGMAGGIRPSDPMAAQRAALGTPGIAGMGEADIESMRRNQAVASTAIQRAMADANSGDYESGIETLVTAISLIKQSSTANADSSQVLVQSLQDCLHGLEAQLMTKGRDKDRDSRGYSPADDYREERRHRSRRHRSRSRSRSRERRRSFSPREHRSRSRERSSRRR